MVTKRVIFRAKDYRGRKTPEIASSRFLAVVWRKSGRLRVVVLIIFALIAWRPCLNRVYDVANVF